MKKSDRYRILVADDHSVVRSGLKALLESVRGAEVCAEATDGLQAVTLSNSCRPDLAVLDLTMPKLGGLEATRRIRAVSPATAVLILTMHYSEEILTKVRQAGAHGFVLKADADLDLLNAVDCLRRGGEFFRGYPVSERLRHPKGIRRNRDQAPSSTNTRLTERQITVVKLLGNGYTNKQIASELGLSIRTIEATRSRIMRKLNFKHFSDLIRFVVRSGLAEEELKNEFSTFRTDETS